MRTLVWSSTFVRALRRAVRRQPGLRARVEHTLQQLAKDPFHPSLHSHKLKGELVGAWACTVDYDNRVIFEFARNVNTEEEEILLLTMGTHDEVYYGSGTIILYCGRYGKRTSNYLSPHLLRARDQGRQFEHPTTADYRLSDCLLTPTVPTLHVHGRELSLK